MIVWKYNSILMALVLTALVSCKRNDSTTQVRNHQEEKESLVKVNKFLVEKDIDLIESYVKRRGWEMEVTNSGLWYMIYEEGSGPEAAEGKIITMDYRISLLDGRLCYDSKESGPRQFLIGKGGVESGLEEGVLLLRKGDKARLIMPPHLAHGLLGDEENIPARSIIIYDLEVLDISEF